MARTQTGLVAGEELNYINDTQVYDNANQTTGAVYFWLQSTDTGPATISNAAASDGTHTVPVTCNGKSTFNVYPNGRWSDPIDTSSLDATTIDFLAEATGIIPKITPDGQSERLSVVMKTSADISYDYSDDCSSLDGWVQNENGGAVVNGQFKLDYEQHADGIVSKNIGLPPDRFILEINASLINIAALLGAILELKYYGIDWVLDVQMDTDNAVSGMSIATIGDDNMFNRAFIGPFPPMSTIHAYRFIVDKSGGSSTAIVKVMINCAGNNGWVSLGTRYCNRADSGTQAGILYLGSSGGYPE